MPESATTTISATICLQLGALFTSLVFYCVLHGQWWSRVFLVKQSLSMGCRSRVLYRPGGIGYLYLFGGIGVAKPMPASIAIPVIVSSTIVISLLASVFLFKETVGWVQFLGAGLIIAGIAVLFIK